MYTVLHARCPLFVPNFNEHLFFLYRFSKNSQMSNLIKIRPVGAELFHEDGRTDRQTDMTKLTVALRNFVSAPNSCIFIDVTVSLRPFPWNGTFSTYKHRYYH